jgi:hypothetical protein
VSKNVGVARAFENIIGEPIIVDEIGHLMGAMGIAIMARDRETEKIFDFGIKDMKFYTAGVECGGCPNNCEVVCVFNDQGFIDGWGNRCERGIERAKAKLKEDGRLK